MIEKKVYRFKELASTNEFAKGILKESPEGTLIIADKQTNGKGRLGKSWYSPEEGLWFSVILKPNNVMSRANLNTRVDESPCSHQVEAEASTYPVNVYQLLPLLAGVAVCEAMSELGVRAKVKWSNDILINKKKVAGILSEFVDGVIILGMGINLNIREFPEEIKSTATSLLLEKGETFDKDIVLKLILEKIEEKYRLVWVQNFEPILDEWRSYSDTFGKRVAVNTPTGVLQGEMIDIDSDGALLLKLPSGNIEKIFAGECSLIQNTKLKTLTTKAQSLKAHRDFL